MNTLSKFISLFVDNPKATLAEIEKTLGISKETLNVLVDMLNLFNILTVRNGTVEVKGDQEKRFLKSLLLYIDNNSSLIANWSTSPNQSDSDEEAIFNWGTRFLHGMEKRRVNKLGIKQPLLSDNVALLIIKAKLKDEGTKYLFQFNTKSLQLQLIGGFFDKKTQEDSISKLINKELSLNELDYEIEPIKQYTTGTFSKKKGVYLEYNINVFHCIIDSPQELNLSPIDEWVSLEEMIRGKNEDEIDIISPFNDFDDKSSLTETFNNLNLSLRKEQPSIHKPNKMKKSPIKESFSLNSIINNEESSRLEFKSSIRWDYRQNKVNKDLEKVVVKIIASFLNSKGGTLLVGVSDDKEILGIDPDLSTISKKNQDGFHQLVIHLMTSYIGAEFCSFINVSFQNSDSKTICIVEVKPSLQPVFYREKENIEFYIRTGNATKKLNPEETYKYININW